MSPTKRAPEPIARPALALWVWQRFHKFKDAGEYFGMSWEAVRSACLPFGHPDRSVPRRDTLQRIFDLTDGEITPDSFHQLTPPAPLGQARQLAEAH